MHDLLLLYTSRLSVSLRIVYPESDPYSMKVIRSMHTLISYPESIVMQVCIPEVAIATWSQYGCCKWHGCMRNQTSS